MRTSALARAATALLSCCVATACAAQSPDVASFYAGRQVKMIVGTGPGGGYDIYGRLLARHIGRHIPGGPNVVVVNMPGAASLMAANYLANIAPRDGTEMLMVVQALPLQQVAGNAKARFDLGRFNWIGNMSDAANTVLAWRTTGVKTFADARGRELVMGSTTPSSLGGIYPAIMNKVLGARFKIIYGYESGDAIDLALERGEVTARAGVSWAALKAYRANWLRDGLVNVFAQVGLAREPDLDAPLLTELAQNDADREVLRFYSSLVALGRAVTAGPGVPPERVAALRHAFDDAMADPALKEEAARQGLELRGLSGASLQEVVAAMVRQKADRLFLDRGMIE
jgi:hypothetical protein